MKTQNEIYDDVTKNIISILESGEGLKWLQNWHEGIAKNYATKKHYRGINALILKMDMARHNYKQPFYMTFLQIQKAGGRVKKGEKATAILFYELKEVYKKVCAKCELIKCECEGRTEKEKVLHIPLLKTYSVFNVEQAEGLNIKEEAQKTFNPIERAEAIITGYEDKPRISNNYTKCFYSIVGDFVGIPKKELFNSEADYYSALFHELSHSTGHEKRLKRLSLTKEQATFGSSEYSKEEVIAELSTAFLCAETQIQNSTIKNSSAYIKSWIANLKEDNRFIFKVSSEAQKSADYILKRNKSEVAKCQ